MHTVERSASAPTRRAQRHAAPDVPQSSQDGDDSALVSPGPQQTLAREDTATSQPSTSVACIVCGASDADGPLWHCPTQATHVCCHECVNHFTQARVSDGMLTIPCPCGYAECAHELPEAVLTSIHVDEVAEQYTTLKRMYNSPHAVQCPGCDRSQVGNPRHPDMQCSGCDIQFCFHHGLAHAGTPCQVKKEGVGQRLRNWHWRYWHTRKCKKCGFRIQKNGGCSHMTCRCGHEICWKCGGDYNR